MNSKLVYACTICYTTYPTRDEAVECIINKCNGVESQYQCEECESFWPTSKDADFCCSEGDTLEYREQFEDGIAGVDDIEGEVIN